VWSGTTKGNIQKLQLIQNFAARVITGTRRFDHISPILRELGWLSIDRLLRLRDVAMMYKCLNQMAPEYLIQKLTKRSETHSYNTRTKDNIFNMPWCRTKTSQRSFFFHGPKSWNSLPDTVKTCQKVH
jgi:hypothetical protein